MRYVDRTLEAMAEAYFAAIRRDQPGTLMTVESAKDWCRRILGGSVVEGRADEAAADALYEGMARAWCRAKGYDFDAYDRFRRQVLYSNMGRLLDGGDPRTPAEQAALDVAENARRA